VETREPVAWLPLVEGVSDDTVTVAAFFENFDWGGDGLDAETLSAEAFLKAIAG
jgi:hypothetical protein